MTLSEIQHRLWTHARSICVCNLWWKSFGEKFSFPLANLHLTDVIYVASNRDGTLLRLNLARMQQQ